MIKKLNNLHRTGFKSLVLGQSMTVLVLDWGSVMDGSRGCRSKMKCNHLKEPSEGTFDDLTGTSNWTTARRNSTNIIPIVKHGGGSVMLCNSMAVHTNTHTNKNCDSLVLDLGYVMI